MSQQAIYGCGENYLSQEIATDLLKQVEDAPRAGVQVDIRKYIKAA